MVQGSPGKGKEPLGETQMPPPTRLESCGTDEAMPFENPTTQATAASLASLAL